MKLPRRKFQEGQKWPQVGDFLESGGRQIKAR
jgi:hypothetical protein